MLVVPCGVEQAGKHEVENDTKWEDDKESGQHDVCDDFHQHFGQRGVVPIDEIEWQRDEQKQRTGRQCPTQELVHTLTPTETTGATANVKDFIGSLVRLIPRFNLVPFLLDDARSLRQWSSVAIRTFGHAVFVLCRGKDIDVFLLLQTKE